MTPDDIVSLVDEAIKPLSLEDALDYVAEVTGQLEDILSALRADLRQRIARRPVAES